MDILTPRGQVTLMQEADAIQRFLNEYRNFDYIQTPKDRPADIDGFILSGGTIISGVEVKCRVMHYDDLMNKFAGLWLVTYDKIERGIAVCRSLCVDFRGFLYLVPDDTLLIVKIYDYKSGKICDMDLEETRTQETVNGGSIVRLNAYIDVRDATVLRGDQYV